MVEHAAVPAPIVNLGGDEAVSMEEIIAYIESITDLKIPVETHELASWQMTVLDNAKRKSMAGPCKVHWKDGIRSAMEVRYPDLLK